MAQARRVPRANEDNKMFIVMALLIILGKEQNNLTFWQVIESQRSVWLLTDLELTNHGTQNQSVL